MSGGIRIGNTITTASSVTPREDEAVHAYACEETDHAGERPASGDTIRLLLQDCSSTRVLESLRYQRSDQPCRIDAYFDCL